MNNACCARAALKICLTQNSSPAARSKKNKLDAYRRTPLPPVLVQPPPPPPPPPPKIKKKHVPSKLSPTRIDYSFCIEATTAPPDVFFFLFLFWRGGIFFNCRSLGVLQRRSFRFETVVSRRAAFVVCMIRVAMQDRREGAGEQEGGWERPG